MTALMINKTPVRTCNHFGMNEWKLDEELFAKNKNNNSQNISQNKFQNTLQSISHKQFKYGLGAEAEENIFLNLNNSIHINSEGNEKKEFNYIFDDDNTSLYNVIEMEVSGNYTFVLKYEASTKKQCFHNGSILIKAKKDAVVNGVILNFLNNKSYNLEQMQVELAENARVNLTVVDIGGAESITNYYSALQGDYSVNNVKTIYIGKGEEKKDFNYISEVYGKNAVVDIDMKGALNDNSKKHFKGTIDFKKACTDSKGNEYEYCYLLSKKAKSLSLPMLLCTEESVEGNHGTASGKMDENVLFYLMSRGIEKKEAVRLLVNAGFKKMLESVSDEKLREDIQEKIDRRF